MTLLIEQIPSAAVRAGSLDCSHKFSVGGELSRISTTLTPERAPRALRRKIRRSPRRLKSRRVSLMSEP